MAQATKTVRLKFKSGEGKSFTVSMANAAEALTQEGGEALARATVDQLMLDQPFNRTIAECTGVDVVERKVTAVL